MLEEVYWSSSSGYLAEKWQKLFQYFCTSGVFTKTVWLHFISHQTQHTSIRYCKKLYFRLEAFPIIPREPWANLVILRRSKKTLSILDHLSSFLLQVERTSS